MPDNPEMTLWAEAMYGMDTRRGLVSLSAHPAITVTPGEARDYAHNIIEAADAAEVDEILVQFIEAKFKLPLGEVVPLLREFRSLRAGVNNKRAPGTAKSANQLLQALLKTGGSK